MSAYQLPPEDSSLSVQELKVILERMPDDAPVVFQGSNGYQSIIVGTGIDSGEEVMDYWNSNVDELVVLWGETLQTQDEPEDQDILELQEKDPIGAAWIASIVNGAAA